MIIEKTSISGVNVIASEPFKDDRGFFNRIFCRQELNAVKPGISIAQINHSMTRLKGSIRGMHFQHSPYAEMKIVRCIKGSIFDVAVDLRKGSPTLLKWHAEVLSAENMKAMIIPEGCAHGFQALEDDAELVYMVTSPYAAAYEGAVRHDEPLVNISWPLGVTIVSDKDKNTPRLTADFNGLDIK